MRLAHPSVRCGEIHLQLEWTQVAASAAAPARTVQRGHCCGPASTCCARFLASSSRPLAAPFCSCLVFSSFLYCFLCLFTASSSFCLHYFFISSSSSSSYSSFISFSCSSSSFSSSSSSFSFSSAPPPLLLSSCAHSLSTSDKTISPCPSQKCSQQLAKCLRPTTTITAKNAESWGTGS